MCYTAPLRSTTHPNDGTRPPKHYCVKGTQMMLMKETVSVNASECARLCCIMATQRNSLSTCSRRRRWRRSYAPKWSVGAQGPLATDLTQAGITNAIEWDRRGGAKWCRIGVVADLPCGHNIIRHGKRFVPLSVGCVEPGSACRPCAVVYRRKSVSPQCRHRRLEQRHRVLTNGTVHRFKSVFWGR
jgi:hypothetical protein